MRFLVLFSLFVISTFSFSPNKQALIDFEMGSYFLQGQDFDNAEKYLVKAQGKLGISELEIVLSRNLAQVYLLKEDKEKLFSVLESCIEKADETDIKESAALREVYQIYARLKADAINPSIMNTLLQKRQQQLQDMQPRKPQPSERGEVPPTKAQPPAPKKPEKPRLGF